MLCVSTYVYATWSAHRLLEACTCLYPEESSTTERPLRLIARWHQRYHPMNPFTQRKRPHETLSLDRWWDHGIRRFNSRETCTLRYPCHLHHRSAAHWRSLQMLRGFLSRSRATRSTLYRKKLALSIRPALKQAQKKQKKNCTKRTHNAVWWRDRQFAHRDTPRCGRLMSFFVLNLTELQIGPAHMCVVVWKRSLHWSGTQVFSVSNRIMRIDHVVMKVVHAVGDHAHTSYVFLSPPFMCDSGKPALCALPTEAFTTHSSHSAALTCTLFLDIRALFNFPSHAIRAHPPTGGGGGFLMP